MMTSVFKKILLAGLWLVLCFGVLETKAIAAPCNEYRVTGPSSLDERTDGTYQVEGRYCAPINSSTWAPVTNDFNYAWEWSIGGIVNSSNVITAPSVTSTVTTSVKAHSYGYGVSASKPVIVNNTDPVTLSSVSIGTNSAIQDVYNNALYVNKQSVIFYLNANYSDGSSSNVTNSANWSGSCLSASCPGVSFSGSTVNFSNITQNVTYKVTGQYGGKEASWTLVARAKLPSGAVINGSPSVPEQQANVSQYSRVVRWDDNSTDEYFPTGWNVTTTTGQNINYATITSSGMLSTSSIIGDKLVKVKNLSHGLVNYFPDYPDYNASALDTVVTINDDKVILTGLVVNGPNEVDEFSSTQYTATAVYDDVTKNANVTTQATWSDVSETFASLQNGLLVVGDVPSDSINPRVNVHATYTHAGVTEPGRISVAINLLKELTGLTIQGPVTLNENGSASYSAIAAYSDNTTGVVTENVTWSLNSAYAAIENGDLRSVSVTRNQSAVLTASYSEDGKVVVSEPFNVTIIDLGLGLVDLVIDGPASIDENGLATYVARAVYDDGSDAVVDAVWNENSAFASVDATGAVNTSDVSTDQAFSLSAQYTANNVTHNAKRNLTLLDTDANVGVTARVSIDSNEVESNGESGMPAVSLDGRYVAFESVASNLDINSTDVDGLHDVFIRDRQQRTTEIISVVAGGVQADGLSRNLSISGDGQLVAFESELTSTSTVNNIYVRDRANTLTEHVSLAAGGGEANGDSYNPSISSDGRYVVFESVATNLTTTSDTINPANIYVNHHAA